MAMLTRVMILLVLAGAVAAAVYAMKPQGATTTTEQPAAAAADAANAGAADSKAGDGPALVVDTIVQKAKNVITEADTQLLQIMEQP